MSKIRFLDVGWTRRTLSKKIDEAVKRVLDSGWYIHGDELEAFEKEFAHYAGAKSCTGVGNGLDALELSLRAAGIGAGDDVLVPSNTFIATWLAVTRAGANPVPVEPVEATYNMDPEKLEEAYTPKTKAIIPVHLYGQTADMDPIMEFAQSKKLFVLTDAAQAHGAYYKGRMAGSLGNAAAFSFYPGKNLGAFGDGGAVLTNDPDLAAKIKVIGNYGAEKKYHHESLGFNSRLDEIQAAVLRIKLDKLDNWNWHRKELAAIYMKELDKTPLVLPYVPEWSVPAWHLFVVRTNDREALMNHLAQNDIESMIHYPIPPHKQGAYSDKKDLKLPISEKIHREVLSLPIGPHLKAEQIMQVCSVIKDFFK